jgi:hypothetical protein
LSTNGALPGLIIGAALTLAATLIVQILDIPWVQGRTRNRERWETDVVDLLNVLEEQLPRSVSRLHNEADTQRLLNRFTDRPGYNQEFVREELRRAHAARRDADNEVTQHIERTRMLVARLSRRRKKATYWKHVELRAVLLRGAILDASISTVKADPAMDDDQWDASWVPIGNALKALTERVEPLRDTMKPPRRQSGRRLLARLRRLGRRVLAAARKVWRWRPGHKKRSD